MFSFIKNLFTSKEKLERERIYNASLKQEAERLTRDIPSWKNKSEQKRYESLKPKTSSGVARNHSQDLPYHPHRPRVETVTEAPPIPYIAASHLFSGRENSVLEGVLLGAAAHSFFSDNNNDNNDNSSRGSTPLSSMDVPSSGDSSEPSPPSSVPSSGDSYSSSDSSSGSNSSSVPSSGD